MIPSTIVLDRGWVELQAMMGSDLSIVNAARVSHLGENKSEERDKELLRFLLEHDHGTPFEMAVFRFRVRAPEMVFRQWVRHRIGSFNVQSRRYTKVQANDLHWPLWWRMDEASEPDSPESLELYQRLEMVYKLSIECYERALELGAPKEQARLFLPGFAVYSTFVWAVNARSLMNFLKLRLGEGAQWEIGQFALAVWDIFEEKLPWTAEIFAEKLNGR